MTMLHFNIKETFYIGDDKMINEHILKSDNAFSGLNVKKFCLCNQTEVASKMYSHALLAGVETDLVFQWYL